MELIPQRKGPVILFVGAFIVFLLALVIVVVLHALK